MTIRTYRIAATDEDRPFVEFAPETPEQKLAMFRAQREIYLAEGGFEDAVAACQEIIDDLEAECARGGIAGVGRP